jgi:glycosyltransferase involved in cell wall biosynthesis
MIIAVLVVLLLYLFCVGAFIYGNLLTTEKSLSTSQARQVDVSLIIPFRNEEGNLRTLLDGLKHQHYTEGRWEVICVNDHSTDRGRELVEAYMEEMRYLTLINLKELSGKKAAIQEGVTKASGELIITTDADCTHRPGWIASIVKAYVSTEADMIIGAVHIKHNGGLRNILEETEQAALSSCSSGGTMIGRSILCSGANLAYKKELFQWIKPFDNNRKVASGDDMFFLHELKKRKQQARIHFLRNPEGLVQTRASSNWSELLHQKIRWVAKSKYYKDKDTSFFGVFLVAGNLLLVLGLLMKAKWVLPVFIIKYVADTFLLSSGKEWTGIKHILGKAFLLSLIYPFYSVSFVLLSFIVKPKWKGRSV